VLGLSDWGVSDEGRDVEVTLQVVLGRLEELEVWAGWDGGELRTALPLAESLRRAATGGPWDQPRRRDG
jgi:hypothetical protein